MTEDLTIRCPFCPFCGGLPTILIGPWQVMCSNEDCEILMWDMTITAVANIADAGVGHWSPSDPAERED